LNLFVYDSTTSLLHNGYVVGYKVAYFDVLSDFGSIMPSGFFSLVDERVKVLGKFLLKKIARTHLFKSIKLSPFILYS
ncbi:MAG: hypothetical protein KDC52_06195, partial [Ignavibacteriae bacterium]|nr:hypothetical protein [Ignavibacteriota bacterium]